MYIILKYWKNHQKAFILLTPHFYKEFKKIIFKTNIIYDTDEIYEKNSKYLMNAILTHITHIALENENNKFNFIKPDHIKDSKDISMIGNIKIVYKEVEFNKHELNRYIDEIYGKQTKNKCNKEFKKFIKDIRTLLKNLKKEIDEY